MRLNLIFFLLIHSLFATAQVKDTLPHKQLPAVRTNKLIVIDGKLEDDAWKEAAIATDFIEQKPTFGRKEKFENRTEIKICYSNDAIYISGFCHEATNDSISTELVGRDEIGINDFVGITFDTYNDKINGFGYYITPLGEQYDAKYSSTGEDGSWNSVYKSSARIVTGGWVFEMAIPYAAIRFSKNKLQDWGINITRRRKKAAQQLFWNPVNPAINSYFTQLGLWTNIQDIQPPLRLSLSPYVATYVNDYSGATQGTARTSTVINGGMDIKYGLNQAMTLDMTLIPDFGQVQSDNQVYNLTPFEVQYNENRSFFTEGTELFSKGNLFYSRRIGGKPINQYKINISGTDSIVKNPSETKLLNATKLSGRTAKGWGIGIFNAVTQAQFATVLNGAKQEYKVETAPLTNYNIVVIDKSLKNNSSISFINTSVWRAGNDYDANVTALLWDVYDKKNTWNFNGKMATSQRVGYLPNQTVGGYNHVIGGGKVSGRFNFQLSQELANDKYTHEDMGYYTNNNYINHNAYLGYKWLQPNKWRNAMYLNINMSYSQRFIPRSYQSFVVQTNINGQFKNLWSYYFSSDINASEDDYYEPRVGGKVFKRPDSWNLGFYISTNSAKKLAFELGYFKRFFHTNQSQSYFVEFDARYRFNNRFSFANATSVSNMNNNYGFSTIVNDSIIFALRNVTTIENLTTLKYSFSNTMSINLRVRHYWSQVTNNQYRELKDDGTTAALNGISVNTNANVNFFNVDMVYTWQFALGSFLNIGWKNAIEAYDNSVKDNYFTNISNTLKNNQLNTLSVKIIYFFDYLQLKKLLHTK